MQGSEVEVMLLVDLPSFADVLQRVENTGLLVDRRAPTAGTVTGRIGRDRLLDLEHVEGVLSVELTDRVQLAPPDAEVQ